MGGAGGDGGGGGGGEGWLPQLTSTWSIAASPVPIEEPLALPRRYSKPNDDENTATLDARSHALPWSP